MWVSGAKLTIAAWLVAIVASLGCQQLAGRSENRKGSAAFREMRFIEAVAHYEQAVRNVDDPIVHYNLALAYSKVFRQGAQGNVIIDRISSESRACEVIPGVTTVSKRVCVKQGDSHMVECDEAHPCAAGFRCESTSLCALDNKRLADLATQHFGTWLQHHPSDAETRSLMTQVWIDSGQYKKAIDYWEALDRTKPNDPSIMGNLAGINLKANEWRKSIEWYLRVATHSPESSAKVAAYQFIGNVAWSKLNAKGLPREQAVELADRGMGALQKAAEIQPENPKLYALMGSISAFRALQHGASWAGGIDRAFALDLQQTSRVMNDKAKKQAGRASPTLPVIPPPSSPSAASSARTESSGS